MTTPRIKQSREHWKKEAARLEVCCQVKDAELDALRKREDQLMAEVVKAKEERSLTMLRNSALQDMLVRVQRQLIYRDVLDNEEEIMAQVVRLERERNGQG